MQQDLDPNEKAKMWNSVKKHMKIIKTCNLYLSVFSLGLGVALTGPCLLELQRMVGTDTQHIAFIYTAKSIGYLVGAVLGGILLDMVESKQAVLTACNFLITASLFGIPWSRDVAALMGLMVINGLALGAIDTGANVVCLQLWGSGPFFQALHFSFGLGGFVAPLIAAPFLSDDNDLTDSNGNVTHLEDLNFNVTSNFTAFEGVANITYPFSIVGAVTLFVSILFFAVCLISPTEEKRSESNQESKSNRGYLFLFNVVALTFLIVFVAVGMEIGYGQMLTTYAVKGRLHASTSVGSYMTSVYWAAFTIARLASIFISIKINNLTLFVVDIIIVGISGLILLFFMPSEWALWTASVVFGIGIASGYPALVGWIDNFILITNKIAAIFVVGCAAGEMVMPFIIAYFMETIPEMFVYIIVASCIVIFVLLIVLHLVFKQVKRKDPPKEICYVISIKALQT